MHSNDEYLKEKAYELVDEKEQEFYLASIPAGMSIFAAADLTRQHLGDAQEFPQHLPPKRMGTDKGQVLHSVGREVVCV